MLLWISSLALVFKVLSFNRSMARVTPGYSRHWGAQHTLVAEVPIPFVRLSGEIFWQAGGPAVMLFARVTVKTALQECQQLLWVLSSSSSSSTLQGGWKGTCHSWSKHGRSCRGAGGDEACDVRKKLGG